MTRYYKALNNDLQSCHNGDCQWIPREWTPPQVVNPCRTGYHLCASTEQLLDWLGETVWIAEARGEIVDHGGTKVVCESARITRQLPWDDRKALLFAADCAEHVLHLYEERQVNYASRRAIEVARAYAASNATNEDLKSAYSAAAWSAAWATARSAARSAAEAAGAAAYVAARAASRSAAEATWVAAEAAERRWQADRLAWYLDGCPLPAQPVVGR